jgi:hypothetical protein
VTVEIFILTFQVEEGSLLNKTNISGNITVLSSYLKFMGAGLLGA